jgi:uncharacterized damage-inducible protein DinB
MSLSEPGISFRELFAYTDRWLNYFTRNEAALEIDVGGQTGTHRNLVNHIFEVEQFFANRLLEHEPSKPTRESPALADLLQTHQDANQKLERYIKVSGDVELNYVVCANAWNQKSFKS